MNIEKIRARAEAAKAETNVFHRTKPLMPEDLELSLADDGYNPCLLRIMAHALFDIPALLDALEAKERELAAAVSDMKIMALAMRESEELSEGCCFACVCDAQNLPDDCILPYGECPGYEKDDCFEWRGRKEQNDG